MTRRRADVVLTERGLFPSRERAKAAILAGDVRVDGAVLTKAGEAIEPDASIEVAERPQYVSRGGLKLAGALEYFGIDPTGVRAVDVGASTGGFTDCLLQQGAVSVAAIDVGYGQLAWELRNDERVAVFERANIRHVVPDDVGAPFDLAVVDVSFISLRTVLDPVLGLLGDEGRLLALVKPQFEAGKGRVGKKGVVRDATIHEEVLEDVVSALVARSMDVDGMTWSPITGPEGNIEFWVWASRGEGNTDVDVPGVVAGAHEMLGG
jgi:23S rRNA (cytidine1920-2'-O)/16S rRNA (cytidine1409-2'-O)-methyltransferase